MTTNDALKILKKKVLDRFTENNKKIIIDEDDVDFIYTTPSLKTVLESLEEEKEITFIYIKGGEFINGEFTKNRYKIFKLK